jgi:hypothetical protein
MPGPYYEIDTPSRTYGDLRSNARSRKRGRDNYHKYAKYTTVNRGQRTLPHFESLTHRWSEFRWPADFAECDVAPLPPREYWEMARRALRCDHHHSCPNKKDYWQIRWVEHKRGSLEARRAAREWQKTGEEPVIRALHKNAWITECDYLENSVHTEHEDLVLYQSLASLQPVCSMVNETPVAADDEDAEYGSCANGLALADSFDAWDLEDFVLVDGDDESDTDWTDLGDSLVLI